MNTEVMFSSRAMDAQERELYAPHGKVRLRLFAG